MFRPCLHQGLFSDFIEGMIFGGAFPPAFCFVDSHAGDFLHHIGPGPVDHGRIAHHQIGAGNLQVDVGLLVGLPMGAQEALGLGLIARFETGAFHYPPDRRRPCRPFTYEKASRSAPSRLLVSGLSGPVSVRVRAVSGLSRLKPLFGRARTLTSLKALRVLIECTNPTLECRTWSGYRPDSPDTDVRSWRRRV